MASTKRLADAHLGPGEGELDDASSAARLRREAFDLPGGAAPLPASAARLAPATSQAQHAKALSERLAREARHFGFFEAVDLVERLSPTAVQVGGTGPAEREAIRFEHDPDLTFHTSDLRFITPAAPEAGRPYTIVRSSFLGLFGAVSPLPMWMSEDVNAADADEQPSLRAFYDILHHRLLSLFYRTWQKYRFAASHRSDAQDPFTRRALALVGVDLGGALPMGCLPPRVLLGLAPLVANGARTPRLLRTMAARMLEGMSVEVQSFVLRRTLLLPDQQVTLGVRNTTLGVDVAIGRTVADRTGRFRVVMGPLSSEHFAAVSPGGRLFPALRALLDYFTDGVLEAEVEIQMAADQVPSFRLGSADSSRLGQSTRLGGAGKSSRPLRTRFLLGPAHELPKPQFVDDEAT